MSRSIIKPNQEEDFYVEWSSIVEEPVQWGTREEMISWGIESKRLDRTDQTSSSDLWRTASWVDTEGEIYAQLGWIERSKIKDLCLSLDDRGRATDETIKLLTPFED